MKIHLVEDWKHAWKWISVNSMLAAGALQGAWLAVPDDLRNAMPPHLTSKVTLGLMILGIAGRLIRQGGDNANPNKPL